jgi:prevent-host-death family protein
VKTVNIQAAKTHLSRLVEEAVAGEDIVLAKAGRPLVRLIPFRPKSGKRKLGQFKGRVKEYPHCWDLDPSLEKEFMDSPVLPGLPPEQA